MEDKFENSAPSDGCLVVPAEAEGQELESASLPSHDRVVASQDTRHIAATDVADAAAEAANEDEEKDLFGSDGGEELANPPGEGSNTERGTNGWHENAEALETPN